MDKVNKSHQIASRIYDLIYELNVICPSILLQVLPQLECKLKAGSESERLSKFYFKISFAKMNADFKRTKFIVLFYLPIISHLQKPLLYWRVCFRRKTQR